MSKNCRRTARLLLSLLLSALYCGSVHAAAEYALQSGVSWYRIDNPFLFPNGSSDKLNSVANAWSDDLRGALFLPLPTERSTLQLTAAVSQMHYNGLFGNYTDELSNGGPYSLSKPIKQMQAVYQWEFDELLRGRLSHRTDDRLYGYFGGEVVPSSSAVPPNLSNIEPEFPHLREDSVEVAYIVNHHLDVPLTWTQQTMSYMNPGRVEIFNMRSNALQAAMRYTAGTNSSMTVGIRRTAIDFPDRSAADISLYDSGYTDTELFSDTAWRYTDNTLIKVHLGAISRQFNTLSNSNSKLLSTELGAEWRLSDKTTLSGSFWDRPQASDQADNWLYVISRGAQARAVWQATPKSTLSLLGSLELQKSQSFPRADSSTVLTNGSNKIQRLDVRCDHEITRRLSVRVEAALVQTIANSGSPVTYRGNQIQISLRYTFDNLSGPFTSDNPQGDNHARQQIEALQ